MGTSGAPHDTIITLITGLHSKRGQAWLRRDFEGYLSCYWDDAILFTVDERITVAELRRKLVLLLEAGGGPLELNLPPPADIMVSSEADAITTGYEWSARSQSEDGVVFDRSYHETNVWYRRDGIWKIIRMHLTRLSSTPVNS
jgi:ketosteroid isomerase-like protein